MYRQPAGVLLRSCNMEGAEIKTYIVLVSRFTYVMRMYVICLKILHKTIYGLSKGFLCPTLQRIRTASAVWVAASARQSKEVRKIDTWIIWDRMQRAMRNRLEVEAILIRATALFSDYSLRYKDQSAPRNHWTLSLNCSRNGQPSISSSLSTCKKKNH